MDGCTIRTQPSGTACERLAARGARQPIADMGGDEDEAPRDAGDGARRRAREGPARRRRIRRAHSCAKRPTTRSRLHHQRHGHGRIADRVPGNPSGRSSHPFGQPEADGERGDAPNAVRPEEARKHVAQAVKQRQHRGQTHDGERKRPGEIVGIHQKRIADPPEAGDEIAEAEPPAGRRTPAAAGRTRPASPVAARRRRGARREPAKRRSSTAKKSKGGSASTARRRRRKPPPPSEPGKQHDAVGKTFHVRPPDRVAGPFPAKRASLAAFSRGRRGCASGTARPVESPSQHPETVAMSAAEGNSLAAARFPGTHALPAIGTVAARPSAGPAVLAGRARLACGLDASAHGSAAARCVPA